MSQLFVVSFIALLFCIIVLGEDSMEDVLTARHPHQHRWNCHNSARDQQGVCPGGERCVPTYRCSNSSYGEGLIDIRESFSNPCVDYWLQCCYEDDIISCLSSPLLLTQNPSKESIETLVHPLTERPTERPTQISTERTTQKPTSTTPVAPPDNFNTCGLRSPKGLGYRIIFATHNESEYGEFPWMMAILKRDPASGESYQCGGSLIHPKVVLTAAHCLDGVQPGQLLVRGGEWDTNTDNEPFDTQNRSVAEVVTHPSYYKPGLHNDLALLFLNESMNLDEVVRTVCLPPKGANFDHQNCFVAGWGKKNFNDAEAYQVILKKIELPVVPSAQCEATLRTTALRSTFELHEGFLCAGGEAGRDACTGDGGSALVCAINRSEYYHQAGIVSWGLRCGDPIPGVYVDVSRYREWIDQEMQKHQLDTSSYVLDV